MRPILFQGHGYRVFSYPAMLYIGTVLGVLPGNRTAHAMGLDAFRVWIATLILFAAALAGARLLFVAIEWRRRAPTQIPEGALELALLAPGVRVWSVLPAPGALFLLLAGGYATGRLVLETLREHPATARAFTVQHALSLGIAVVSFTTLAILWKT